MKNKIFLTISLLAAVFVITSCLKDKVGEDWTGSLAGKMYAEVWNPGFAAFGLAPVADTATFRFMVNIATDQPPTQDIQITLAVDENALNDYNAAKGTSYLPYPYIEFVKNPVTIKAGTRNGWVYVKAWNAQLLSPCDNFMAAIVIASASGGVIPADPFNAGARFMALPISNPWAGTYNTVGYRIRPGNPTEPIPWSTEVFETYDCKTVIKVGFGNYTSYSIKIEITSDILVVDGVDCFKVIATPVDANGTVVGGMFNSWEGDPATPPAPPAVLTDINYYNPVTKQFVLNCFYLSSAGNRKMYEVHTRI